MENIEKVIEIANSLGFDDLKKDLERIHERSKQTNVELIFPLVGEFSSGKTTLINALTDSKKLETATKPTTSTIYEIHFGSEKCHARVLNVNGEIVEFDDIAALKNDELSDAAVVNIYDTSNKVPATTILVDTPGLSSPVPRHKQTLIEYLPYADGILLVTDVNQQITRSLTDFIQMMSLSKKPIYMVVTKCDTKSETDLEAVKTYISENCKLPIQQVICVSAVKGDLDELYSLMDTIQINKNHIIQQVDEQRIKIIIAEMLSRIEELLNASSSDNELDESIRKQEYELNLLYRNIDKLIADTKSEIEDKEYSIIREFADTISEKLENIVAGNSGDYDSDAISAINNTATLLFDEYKYTIQNLIQAKASIRKNTDDAISLRSLENMDLSTYTLNGISYNLNLNEEGHKYDQSISFVVKSGVALGAAYVATSVAAAAVAAEAAAASTIATTTQTVATVGTLVDVADTITDVGSIISNKNTVAKMQKLANIAQQTKDKYEEVDVSNQRMGEKIGLSKGIVETMVGFVSDKALGKPQRRKAIYNYMDSTLMPIFKKEIKNVGKLIVESIRESLNAEALEIIECKRSSLEHLKNVRKEKEELFNQKINQIRDYKRELMLL